MNIKKGIYLIFFYSFMYPSDVDIIIKNILNGKNKYSNKEILTMIDNDDFVNDKNILILKGLIELNGEKSFSFFNEYYQDNIKKEYDELAISKMSEYYYTSGLYIKSSIWYKKLIMNYPDSDELKPAINYFLNSLSISGKLDSAKYYSKVLHGKYPHLKFNSNFYEKNKKSDNLKNGLDYSVEVAIYETYSKAISSKSILSSEGFSSRVEEISINNKVMYTLRVGYYKDKKTAENVKKRSRSRLGLSNLIVVEVKK